MRVVRIFAVIGLCVSMLAVPAAQRPRPASCDDLLLPAREVKGRKVGPTSCLMQESAATHDGRAYKRLDIGLNGTVEGWAAKAGEYHEYLTNAPDLEFAQAGNPGPILFAVAKYERDKGAAMTVVFPADRAAWNGKMFVTVHGRGTSFKQGNLKAWDSNLDPADPMRGLDKYDRLMVSKGYALVKTRRTSAEGLGEISATFEDGTVVDFMAFNDTARYIMDFTEVAKKAIARRLGQPPRLSYIYGHSAGARIGRGINYTAGLNAGTDGKPLFNGVLADDSAAGTWLPVLMKDGKDTLFTTEASKAAFVPQIDISHQMYNNIWDHQMPAYMSQSYLANKRHNAQILQAKGLAPAKERMYEVRSISHSGGESGRGGENQNLDLSKMMDRFIDMLDAWADKGTQPPPTRSDWAPLGDANRDGVIENPALAFPEVACPLGVYYPSPNTTSGATAFAPFTGEGIEPLDANKVFVDMNRNGVWDYRETPTAAWRRLGLLQKNETLTRDKYVACVQASATELQKEGFFSEKTATAYIEQARKTDPIQTAARP